MQTKNTFYSISDWVPKYVDTLEINNGSTIEEIQTTITFYSDFRLSLIIYRDARWYKGKFRVNSNNNNFLLVCPIVSRNILRCSILKTKDPSQFKRQSLCTQITDWLIKYIETLDIKMKDASQFNRKQLNTQISNWVPLYIEKLEIKNGSLSKFKWQYIFTPTSDWVPWYITTRKIKNGNSVQIQTAITFYSDIWFSLVIYRVAQN